MDGRVNVFRLYEPSAHWCSEQDYAHIVDVVRERKPQTVLEFGPGWSTLAMIEGGAAAIWSCEDDAHWAAVWDQRLAQYSPQVQLVRYRYAAPLFVPAVNRRTFDLALIDGPCDTRLRSACIDFALLRAAAVLVPLEETEVEEGAGHLRGEVQRLADRHSWRVDITETGPLAGAFALMTPV